MAYETISRGQIRRFRHIPDNIIETVASADGIVYLYQKWNQLNALAYKGTAGKASYHYRYHNTVQGLDRARTRAQEFIKGLAQHREMTAKYRAERNTPHSIPVGAIISNSWGYEQTNVDWYRVVAVTRYYVSLQKIPGRLTPEGGCGPMSGHTVPDLAAEPKGSIRKHRANATNTVSMEHGCGHVWTPGVSKPLYESWYAACVRQAPPRPTPGKRCVWGWYPGAGT